MKIQESAENYLETILMLAEKGKRPLHRYCPRTGIQKAECQRRHEEPP